MGIRSGGTGGGSGGGGSGREGASGSARRRPESAGILRAPDLPWTCNRSRPHSARVSRQHADKCLHDTNMPPRRKPDAAAPQAHAASDDAGGAERFTTLTERMGDAEVGILNHLEPSMHQAISPPSPHPLLPQPPSPPAAERKPTPRRGMSRHTRHWPTRLMTSKAGAAKAADDTPAAQAGQGEAAAETGADTSAVQTGDDTSASQTGEGGLEDRASRHSSDKASRHFSAVFEGLRVQTQEVDKGRVVLGKSAEKNVEKKPKPPKRSMSSLLRQSTLLRQTTLCRQPSAAGAPPACVCCCLSYPRPVALPPVSLSRPPDKEVLED